MVISKISEMSIRNWKGFRYTAALFKGLIAEKITIKENMLAIFDPCKGTSNCGDEIISLYSMKVIKEVFPDEEKRVYSTHILPDRASLRALPKCNRKVVCGTNLMTPHFEWYSLWKIPPDFYGYRNIITIGVGWGYYCDEISDESRKVYNRILSKHGLHSVRDSYTEQKFRKMGINNVINTGCPTMWNLTEEHCCLIPTQKAKAVIATVTDYDQKPEKDAFMLKTLMEEYDLVYVWIQGKNDYEYLSTIIDVDRVRVLENSLEAFENVLKRGNVDYVGTRLHAGIHAMNYRIRSIIIAIDNRAIEMARDFQLPIIDRVNIETDLRKMIQSDFMTKVKIPVDNINLWKAQFKRRI